MPKKFLSNSKTTFIKTRERIFWLQNWQKLSSQGIKYWRRIKILGVISQPLKLKIHAKVTVLRLSTMLQNILNNFKIAQKTTFLSPKIVKNYPSKRANWVKFWLENFNFQDHVSTFRAENTPKNRSFNAKNNA